jgi:hypothetical protein
MPRALRNHSRPTAACCVESKRSVEFACRAEIPCTIGDELTLAIGEEARSCGLNK